MGLRETNKMAKPPATTTTPTPSLITSFFNHPLPIYLSAALLRIVLLLYGLWQDANSPVKYTDIDYLVFTDAARFVSRGQSPYDRETYRYTPVLAWLLLPTARTTGNPNWDIVWFSFGKVLFAMADLVAGWLLVRVLTMSTSTAGGSKKATATALMDGPTARKFAAIWLLNPMVATISTRGSSEGLLGVLVTALLWAVLARRVTLAGLLLGFGVHFKIYPFIYAPAIIWWMDGERMGRGTKASGNRTLLDHISSFITPERVRLTLVSLSTFVGLNLIMFKMYAPPSPPLPPFTVIPKLTEGYSYGSPFLHHTFLHHVTRIDHRHNFSPYNTQLYLASAFPDISAVRIESLAFLPQLLLSCVLIPLVTGKKDLPTSMLAQTFAFVTFNKVCTSQVCISLLLPHQRSSLPLLSTYRGPFFNTLPLQKIK